MLIKNLSKHQKNIVYMFLLATLFNGFISASTSFGDIIARKALSAKDWHITLLVMIWPVSSFFSIWWGRLLEKSNNKSKFFYLIAFLGRLPLLLGFFIGNIYHFLILFTLMLSFNSIWGPAQNAILQNKFDKTNRGKIFGLSMSVANLVSIIFAFIAGKVLDINDSYFKYIFLVLGTTGTIAALLMAGITLKKAVTQKNSYNFKEIFLYPVYRTFHLLKTNKPFARFELGFMIYGLGFLTIQPAIPKFLVDTLQMNYSQTFLGKSVIFPLTMMIMSPLMGKLHDKNHPSKFCAIGFSALSLFPAILLTSSILNSYNIGSKILFGSYNLSMVLVLIAYTLFGLAMSSVAIAWNLGSMHFAGNEDASMYQSVHVTLTGIRGLIAPLLGFLVMKTIGSEYLFAISFVFFVLAGLLSYKHYITGE